MQTSQGAWAAAPSPFSGEGRPRGRRHGWPAAGSCVSDYLGYPRYSFSVRLVASHASLSLASVFAGDEGLVASNDSQCLSSAPRGLAVVNNKIRRSDVHCLTWREKECKRSAIK